MNYQSSHKILSLEALITKILTWRVKERKIVFTNGCFDILHVGHVDYLEKARALGDKLVLGLNSDRSVKALKGESRPILEEQARSRLLASLEFVDAVVLFDEDTPLKLIKAVQPDILVKGGDYEIEKIVGYKEVIESGGKVLTIPLVEGYSTTNIVEKIRRTVDGRR